ncbi:MAG TPA: transaldolase [Dermatophilaceae bacterium]|nr:transaldolase [Dermatophilaceae bacterium]
MTTAPTTATDATPAPLQALAEQGVSIWLDDLSREMITSGRLQAVVHERGVVGVTTNPSIFQAAMSKGTAYDEDISRYAREGRSVGETVFDLTTGDVKAACRVLRPVFDATRGRDGRVSIEVEPALAADADGTVQAARTLRDAVDEPNLLIKIPATSAGLGAVSAVLAEGISVNVTLIFALDRYRGVMNAFLTGLEQARKAGHDLSLIRSVASFFVSRVDTEVDARLDALAEGEHAEQARALRGRAGIANARLAYQAYQEVFSTPRWRNLADDGAHPQRPLWASTGVKDPAYPDTMYVTELVAPETVNTMPGGTLEAVAEHGEIRGDTVTGGYAESAEVLDALERLGIPYAEVTTRLEEDGVAKFVAAWEDLLEGVRTELGKATA